MEMNKLRRRMLMALAVPLEIREIGFASLQESREGFFGFRALQESGELLRLAVHGIGDRSAVAFQQRFSCAQRGRWLLSQLLCFRDCGWHKFLLGQDLVHDAKLKRDIRRELF